MNKKYKHQKATLLHVSLIGAKIWCFFGKQKEYIPCRYEGPDIISVPMI